MLIHKKKGIRECQLQLLQARLQAQRCWIKGMDEQLGAQYQIVTHLMLYSRDQSSNKSSSGYRLYRWISSALHIHKASGKALEIPNTWMLLSEPQITAEMVVSIVSSRVTAYVCVLLQPI